MTRVYLRRHFHYESMIGATFRRLGEYLDDCCLINAGGNGGCPAWPKCRDWWDNQCKVAYPDLPPSEIEAIIEGFEEVREVWLGGSPPISSRTN